MFGTRHFVITIFVILISACGVSMLLIARSYTQDLRTDVLLGTPKDSYNVAGTSAPVVTDTRTKFIEHVQESPNTYPSTSTEALDTKTSGKNVTSKHTPPADMFTDGSLQVQ